jgi:hypothetical protein
MNRAWSCGRWSLVVAVWLGAPVWADTVDARCDVVAKGSNKPKAVQACQFSQRQGFVSIQRADGVRHEFEPKGGRYVDQHGRPVVRQRGLGARGQVWRTSTETIHVVWSTEGLTPAAPADPALARAAAAALLRTPVPEGPFDQSLTLQRVAFRVQSANGSVPGALRIEPKGLSVDNAVQERPIQGRVESAVVADLNRDGSPELYVMVRGEAPRAEGSLVAFSANRRKSLSEIAVPALSDTPGAMAGYRGRDRFSVVGGVLVRRFPVFRDGDADDRPSGVRQVAYRLKPGEATWQLVVERVSED